MTSLYDHAGGDAGLHRLEEIVYERLLSDPELSTLFTHRVPTHVEHLSWFTAESFGGPQRFTDRLGFQYIIDQHRDLHITEAQRARFVELYMVALDEAGMPDDHPFRQAFREHVEFGSQVAMENSNARNDAELNPLRAVPHWTWPGDEPPSD
jgi:hemoglobin